MTEVANADGMRVSSLRQAPPVPSSTRRARAAVALLYVIMGMMLGAWGARVPEIRDRISADDAAWGLVNTVAAAGDVLALGVVVFLVGRANTRRMSLLGASGILLNALLLGFATTLPTVIGSLLIWYFCAQLMATPMGALAMEVQKYYGRPLLSSFNACFSIAVLVGSGTGAMASALGVTPGAQFALTGGVLGLALVLSRRWIPHESRPKDGVGGARRKVWDRFTPKLRLVALLSFLSAFTVSVSTQWSALYVADEIGAGPTVGAVCYTVMSSAGILALLAGDSLIARVGPTRLLRAGTFLAGVGLITTVIFDSTVVAVIGLTVLAVGIAGNSPIIDGFAARQPELSAAEGMSASELGQMPGFFLAPAVIGTMAGLVGLRVALLMPILAIVTIMLLAGRLQAEPQPARGRG